MARTRNVTKSTPVAPVVEENIKSNTPILKDKDELVVENTSDKEEEGTKKVSRTRHTLPAKYSKFIDFGYYLLNKITLDFIQDANNESVVLNEQMLLNKLHLLDPIDMQQQLVQQFFDESKDIHKNIRDVVKTQKKIINKENKVKKPRAPRVKKVKDTDNTDTEDVPKPVKEKKTRVKKNKTASSEDALVDELVNLAVGKPTSPTTPSLTDKKADAIVAVNAHIATIPPLVGKPTVSPTTPSLSSDVVEEKPIKEKKEKPVKEKKEKPVKEKKEKPVKEKKEKTDKLPSPLPHNNDDDDEEELNVSVFIYDAVNYLIDDKNNVYDFNTHLPIATLVDDKLVLL